MKQKYVLLKFLFVFFLSPLCAQNNPIPTVEYQALVDFYNVMGGDNWITKWDITTNNLHTTDWHGVVVENEHVVEIILPRNRVIGAISSTFSNLKHLRKLDLTSNSGSYGNDLSATDLGNLSGLESLEDLTLSYCKLSGTIPSSWSQLTKLKNLNLYYNTFEGIIFSEIGNLTDLETINLSFNGFTTIPASIGNLGKLKTLNLSYNKLTGLPEELEDLTSLTSLNVNSNAISDIEAFLPASVYLPVSSQVLTLDEFVYNGEDVLLTTLPNITRYDRNKNDFSALNRFYVRINGSNIQTYITMNADGSLLIPKDYLNSLTEDKEVSLYQTSGSANASIITFAETTVDLEDVTDIEYQALVDFYNATGGDTTWQTKWDVSVNNLNLGAWYGLVIEDGHIVEINLPRNRVNGAIPASFSDLKFLRKLDLTSTTNYYANDLSTTDLDHLSGLESLEDLSLSYCKLSGNIPDSWSALTNLKFLNLSHNTFSGTVFSGIGDLTALESIDLSYNQFEAVPSSFGALVNLKTLTLNNNNFEGPIFGEISSLTALETINFSYNGFTTIPTSIGSLVNLKTFNLTYNKLTGLPEELEDLTSLTSLTVNSNAISDIEAFLPTSVYLPVSSQVITLDEFVYNGDDVLLTNLPNITRYDRNKNDFSALNRFYFRIDGSNIQTYLTMNADGNLLIPKDYLSAVAEDKVVSLYQTSGSASASTISFAETTVDLPGVPEIEYQALVDFYNATGGDTNWQTKWDVSVNNLNLGAWYGLVIEDGHIVEINLPRNRVNGAIPASFSDLKFLRKLDLTSTTNYYANDLSTTDLDHLSGLESLEDLSLSYCKLSGNVPDSWSALTNLKFLNLSHNTFSGTVFSDIGDLTALESIDLSYNQFEAVPSSFGALVNLKTLTLNNNNFEGPIFDEISSLTALEDINFSYNGFTTIPTSIGSLVNLNTFNLTYNKLTVLPEELEDLTSLTSLNVNSNEISDIEAFLPTSVYVPVSSQRITLDEFVYNGEEILLTNLPNITRYDRNKNDFSALNRFYFRIDGSNIQTYLTMNADGSLLIPKDYLNTLTEDKVVSLYQTSGSASASLITFAQTTVDLEEVADIEYQALVDFYNATGGVDFWQTKWDVSVNNLNMGAWHGLVIEEGHIVEINLPQNRLNGAIPLSFSDLKFLKKLDLSSSYSNYYNNNLSTTDLANLSGLERLEELNLSYCKIANTLPSSWSQLTNLKHIVLSNNTLEGAVFSEIGNLVLLESIDFSRNNLTAIPATLGYLTNLKSLNLSYNAINSSDTDFSSLPLTELNFNYQDIQIESIEIGANEINIDLPIPLTVALNDEVVTLDATNEFQLYVNNVYQKTSFSNNGKLVFSNINLLNLQVTDKLRVYQINGLSAYSNIYYDSVTFGAPLVDEEFEILKTIYNETNGGSWINTWDISENNLHIESWFGVSIKDGHVVSLNLFNNNLTGIIPEDITGLPNLKTLILSTNNLSGSIPESINLLTALESLDISSNMISGTIPTGISELQNLKKFAIGNNQFSGTIPAVLSDFSVLEYLDISSNSFSHVDKKLYYDYTNTYIDLRNQIINTNTVLSLEGDQLIVDLGNVATYDLENNNFEAKNTFVLLVDDVTHTTTTTNDLGEIIFTNVRVGEIPSEAKISIRQTTGTFRNTEFNYLGIEDKSNIPVTATEYQALVSFYNSLGGNQWTNSWDTTSNDLHSNKWYGVSTYDGHIVAIDLSGNNLSNTVPDIFDDLPYLNKLNLSSNHITTMTAVLPADVDVSLDRQVVDVGEIDLNKETVITDFSLNRYNHAQQGFNNQTYNLKIGSFLRTVNLAETGVKLIDLIRVWKIPSNEKVELRQVSGDAKNSIINYYLQYEAGDSNLDSNLNVLDIQTSINYILNNYVYYFNYNAADIDGDDNISILDVIKQVNIIQSQEVVPENRSAVIGKTSNGPVSKLRIENGLLWLDTNGNDVASLEILIKGTTKEALTERLSSLGFTVNLVNKGEYVSMIAYGFNAILNGEIELAKIDAENISIKSVILSDVNADEISSEIMESTLSTDVSEMLNTSNIYNFPNPFKVETTLDFYIESASSKATLSIYDMSGRLVEKIILKNLTLGKNQYRFKRKQMASGMYFYHINSNGARTILKGKMTIE
ncbi:leucine-rich repeat domain-containing protein [Algibacter miyuki]|uniref:Leucine-rich repeat domain-containing protein n=1 Tax=Algibacter miyuki TaxID=1306933 RepID=A0ABV5H278_9FLAO|nr:leucine-rich repeat domain-containing protein [Algibacter miyuki]MDN3667365.1 leucine-rich repeat domain-containing protein [Algibacter miyuki]